jgi:molybdopterin molybdotransferase
MLNSLLKLDGIEPQTLGIVKDDAARLKQAAIRGLKADIFLVSGGVSMGDYDFVPEVLTSLGVKKIFHKVNIKPGKPLFFGIENRTLVFGIPGNPVSNFLSYLAFIKPAIQKMMGYKEYNCGFKEGIVEEEFYTKPGRRYFALVKISKKQNHYYLSPITSRSSADTLSLSKADGFMVVDENSGLIKKNSRIKFLTWKII